MRTDTTLDDIINEGIPLSVRIERVKGNTTSSYEGEFKDTLINKAKRFFSIKYSVLEQLSRLGLHNYKNKNEFEGYRIDLKKSSVNQLVLINTRDSIYQGDDALIKSKQPPDVILMYFGADSYKPSMGTTGSTYSTYLGTKADYLCWQKKVGLYNIKSVNERELYMNEGEPPFLAVCVAKYRKGDKSKGEKELIDLGDNKYFFNLDTAFKHIMTLWPEYVHLVKLDWKTDLQKQRDLAEATSMKPWQGDGSNEDKPREKSMAKGGHYEL